MPTLTLAWIGCVACAMYWMPYVCPFRIVISRWRTCASHGFAPLLVTSVQNCPSLRNERPLPGAVNEFVHGMYLPPSKLTFLMRLLPVSFGGSMPGDPFVGAAVQSPAVLTVAGPAGAAAGAAAVAGAGDAGVTQPR